VLPAQPPPNSIHGRQERVGVSVGNGIDIAAVYQLPTRVAETLHVQTQVLNEHTQVLNGHTRVLDGHSNILDAQARVLDEQSSALIQHTRILGAIPAS
jgi:translation elongation factor EF-1alpha